MPFKAIPGTDVTYALLAFDTDGRERTDDHDGVGGRMSQRILRDVAASAPSNVFLFAHGWKGDVPAAIDQYNRWIKAMTDLRADAAAMGPSFKPLWIGLHWPSQPWGDDELGGGESFGVGESSPAAAAVGASELVERFLGRLGGDKGEVRKLLQIIVDENQTNAGAMVLPPHVTQAYRKLAAVIGRKAGSPGGAPDAEDAPFDADAAFEAGNDASAFGGGFGLGGLLGPLRQLSFWKMKSRARIVGEDGMHRFIAELQRALPAAKIHLMGHSFGCIVVSSILGGPGGGTPLPRPVDSVVLVQGALSLWAYARQIPDSDAPGYFHAMLTRGAVRGPIVTTQSVHDTAVGTYYPIAARVASQVALEAGELPKYGAIGAFGIQGAANVTSGRLLGATASYALSPGQVHNLDAGEFIKRMDGASGAHSDIDGPEVAHAIWQAARG